jgi:hypothetical protein
MHAKGGRRHDSRLVPTVSVGMQSSTLCVAKPSTQADAERPGRHSHAERGNERQERVALFF